MSHRAPPPSSTASVHRRVLTAERGVLRRMTDDELRGAVRLLLPDGHAVALRDDQFAELRALCFASSLNDYYLGTRHRGWLRADGDASDDPTAAALADAQHRVGLGFVTRQGETLPLVHTVTTDAPRLDGEALHLLLDQSGSMAGMNEAAFAGVREVIDGLPDEARVTVSTFNNSVRLGTTQTKDAVLGRLHEYKRAQGLTCLFDAIVAAGTRMLHEPATEGTLVILTDGMDTCSRADTTAARIVVERLQALDGHRVLFLGCNDAVLTAAPLGIPPGRAIAFGSRPEHAQRVMRTVSDNMSANRGRFAATPEVEFTPLQRSESVA